MASEEVYAKIEAAEQSMADLHARMDGDRDLYHNEQFKLTDKNGKPMKNVQNLTFNDAQTFGVRVVSTLNSADMQTLVEGPKISKKAQGTVEEFFRLMFQAVDERLEARDIAPLRLFHNEMSALRGRLVTRVLLSGQGSEFIPDIMPCDPRFVAYGIGITGPSWVSVRTFRDPDQVEAEYNFRPQSDNPEVVDYWDADQEIVFIDREQKFQQVNIGGEPPFIVTSVAGSLLTDQSASAKHAESIYSSNRYLYEPMNRIGSILYTEVAKLLKPPMQYRNKMGQRGNPPEQPPYGEGLVIPVGIEEMFENMPQRDLTQAGRLIIAMLEQRLQRGALPAVDYGNLTFPLSAVAIKGLQGAKDQVFLPRLQALAFHFRGIARMIRRQYIAGGFRAELGDDQGRRVFPASEIKGEYELRFKFNAVNPEQDVANYSIAEAAKAWLPDEYILSRILQVDDPLKVINQKWSELAYKSSELLAKYKMAKALIEEGDEVAAKLIADELKMNFESLKSGKISPQGDSTPKKMVKATQGTPVVPLMGGRGAGRPTAGRPAQEQVLQAPETAAAAVGSEG